LDLLKTGHSRLPIFEMVMSHNINFCFSALGAFTNLKELYLSVASSYAWAEVVHLSRNTRSFDFPRLEILVINDLPSFFVLSKLRTPALETLQIVSKIPRTSAERWKTIQKFLWGTFPNVIDFIREAEKLSSFYLNGWFVESDQYLLKLFQALSRVQTICIDTWFYAEDPEQYDGSVLSSMSQLCIHLPDENTPRLPSATVVPGNAGTSNRNSYRTAPFSRQPLYWKSSLSAYLKAYSSAMAKIPQDTLGSGEPFGLDVLLPQIFMEDSEGGEDARDTLEIIQQLPGIDVTLVPCCPVFS
jgi:hypothetical protein